MNKNTNSVTKLISHRYNLCLGYLFLAVSIRERPCGLRFWIWLDRAFKLDIPGINLCVWLGNLCTSTFFEGKGCGL